MCVRVKLFILTAFRKLIFISSTFECRILTYLHMHVCVCVAVRLFINSQNWIYTFASFLDLLVRIQFQILCSLLNSIILFRCAHINSLCTLVHMYNSFCNINFIKFSKQCMWMQIKASANIACLIICLNFTLLLKYCAILVE